jgi:hypothetical protein
MLDGLRQHGTHWLFVQWRRVVGHIRILLWRIVRTRQPSSLRISACGLQAGFSSVLPFSPLRAMYVALFLHSVPAMVSIEQRSFTL